MLTLLNFQNWEMTQDKLKETVDMDIRQKYENLNHFDSQNICLFF